MLTRFFVLLTILLVAGCALHDPTKVELSVEVRIAARPLVVGF
jgi:hypothetical protein